MSSDVSGISNWTKKFCGNPKRATKLYPASTHSQRRAPTSAVDTSSQVRKYFTLPEDVFTVRVSSSAPDRTLYAGSQFVLVFELRPHRLSGLLFHAKNRKTSLNVFLNETEVKLLTWTKLELLTKNNQAVTQLVTDCALCQVGVVMKDGAGEVRVSVTPPESLCDGEFHTVTGMHVHVCKSHTIKGLWSSEVHTTHLSVSQQHGAIRVTVDSASELKATPLAPLSTTLDTLHIGGKSDPQQLIKIYKHTLFSLKKKDLLFLLLLN